MIDNVRGLNKQYKDEVFFLSERNFRKPEIFLARNVNLLFQRKIHFSYCFLRFCLLCFPLKILSFINFLSFFHSFFLSSRLWFCVLFISILSSRFCFSFSLFNILSGFFYLNESSIFVVLNWNVELNSAGKISSAAFFQKQKNNIFFSSDLFPSLCFAFKLFFFHISQILCVAWADLF